MDLLEKLKILSDAAKYDVACTSSGADRASKPGALGSASAAGICHSFSADGRCISLLKILMSNICVYDCKYCVNRRTSDVARAMFEPNEIAELVEGFYRRNYIEGLFLSSAVARNADFTMERMVEALTLVRRKRGFNGYIHVKAIPGANSALIGAAGLLADRVSVNIELPSEDSLKLLAPEKKKSDILMPMELIRELVSRCKEEAIYFPHAPAFAPAGQSTQLIVGATDESDRRIMALAEGLYRKYGLKRVFYSAYMPHPFAGSILPSAQPPLLREHRLYQADWLMRFYGFASGEILKEDRNLSLFMDPKSAWALDNLHSFPVEAMTADYMALLRVPGIGVTSAKRIVSARRVGSISFEDLKRMGVVLKRAKHFVSCNGKMFDRISISREVLAQKLSDGGAYEQLSLFGQGALEDASLKTLEIGG
jgi:putative DNA modification/repair radical SAM protein